MKVGDIQLVLKDLDPEKDYNMEIKDGALSVSDTVISTSEIKKDDANASEELKMARTLIEQQKDQIEQLKESNRNLVAHGETTSKTSGEIMLDLFARRNQRREQYGAKASVTE